MNIHTVYLKFRKDNGEEILVSFSDVLEAGIPINGEGGNEGEEMERVDDYLYSGKGKKLDIPYF